MSTLIRHLQECLRWIDGFWRLFSHHKIAVMGFLIVFFFLFLGIFAEFIAPHEPFGLGDDVLQSPSSKHLFGTDHLGRDIYSRIIYGTRISFIFGFLAAGISMIVGIVLGALPGYYGGWIDDLFSRAFEVFLTIPTLILVILVVAMISTDISFAILIVGLTMWPTNAKITRAQVLSLKTREYALACKGLGGSDMRVLFMHIIPNGLYPIVSNSFVQMAYAILTEASLSFLGLGDLKRISWGLMIFDAESRVLSAPWMAIFPGIAITLLVTGLNLVGDGINLALNPRMRIRESA